MNDLNYLQSINRISRDNDVDLVQLYNVFENKVTQYMVRDNYKGSMIKPPSKYYNRALNVIEEYYKRKSVKEE